jgi:hypothetical protein
MRHYIQSTFVSSYQLNKYVDALSIIIFKYFFTIYTHSCPSDNEMVVILLI